ncbi:MAG: ABC transporter permease [Alphaproteobacteria bacterium]|nr:ABC transporter permease [Alphaproteobacteria bacterium]
MALAWRDLVDGLRRSWLWTSLAQQDIKLRYRGSLLGPFWQTLTTAAMITGMGVIYSHLFHTRTQDYLPLLTLGLIVWTFLSGLLTEGCNTFTSVQGIIQEIKLPFSVHAYRLVYRNILILAHNFIIVPIVLLIFPRPIVWWEALSIVPAFALIAINGLWISMLLGMISARFRDVPPIVLSAVQVVFFLTPVMWPVEALGRNAWWGQFNPFFAAIDVIRAPLLGNPVQPYSWPILLGVTILGGGSAFLLFTQFRHRLAFWV